MEANAWPLGSFREIPDLTRNLFEALRSRQQIFRQLSPWAATGADLSRTGEVRSGRVLFAGGDLFDTWASVPVMGRLIMPAHVSSAEASTHLPTMGLAFVEPVEVGRGSVTVKSKAPR